MYERRNEGKKSNRKIKTNYFLKSISQKCMNLAGICCVYAYFILILSLFLLLVVDVNNMYTEVFLSFSKNGISAFIILTIIGVGFTIISFYTRYYLRKINRIRNLKKQFVLYVILTGVILGSITIALLKSNIATIFQIFLDY